jgi:hypothetical protein
MEQIKIDAVESSTHKLEEDIKTTCDLIKKNWAFAS